MGIELQPICSLPMVRSGDDLAALLARAMSDDSLELLAGDVLVVCQKVVSKAEGRIVRLADVTAGPAARRFAEDYGKDAAVVELALSEATEVLRMDDGHLITRTGCGWICANSGLDRSNQNDEGEVTLLPLDADASAASLRLSLASRFGADIAVIISDTFGRPWRLGQVDVAIGAAGLQVLDDHVGRVDWSGRPLEHTVTAVADQLSAAAGLLMAKGGGVPAVIVRGASYVSADSVAADLVRPSEADLFL